MAELIEWNNYMFRHTIFDDGTEKVELVTFTNYGRILPWAATDEEKTAVLALVREREKAFYKAEWERLLSIPNSQEKAYQLMLRASEKHCVWWACNAHLSYYKQYHKMRSL